MSVDEALVTFTRDRAARLSGLSNRQLDYWRSTNLLRPSTDYRLSAHRPIRLYDFTDMMSLMVIAELKERGVSTRRVRKIVDRLRRHGYEQPLVQVVFGTEPGRKRLVVVMMHSDGTFEGEVHPGQLLLPETIDMETIRARVRRSSARPSEAVGQFERRSGALGRKELFAGTRIPVETVRRYIDHGVSTGEILEAFPALRAADVDAVRDLVAS